MDLTIRIQKKNGEYVASCPELDVHCFGPSKAKASTRLKSVIQFYFDSAQDIQAHTKINIKQEKTIHPQKDDLNQENNAFLH